MDSQLVIKRPEQAEHRLPIEDLGVVIVDSYSAFYTQAVLVRLLEAGAVVVIGGYDHLPLGIVLPIACHNLIVTRHKAQIEASEPFKKRLWQKIIQAKIHQQALVLKHFKGSDHNLLLLEKKVRSGDPDNLEGQAAKRYWPALFGQDFRRDRFGEEPNSLLNYGYSIIRAAIARNLVAAGLITALGVFHKNRSNAFCLADDLFEPYRPFVDWRVKSLLIKYGKVPSIADQETRAALLSLFNEGLRLDGKKVPLLSALELSATSLALSFAEKEIKLSLPSGLPLVQNLNP